MPGAAKRQGFVLHEITLEKEARKPGFTAMRHMSIGSSNGGLASTGKAEKDQSGRLSRTAQ
jgi:hypothetical protein